MGICWSDLEKQRCFSRSEENSQELAICFSDDVAGSVISDETGLSAQAAAMYFQRQGCAAKGAFRQQSADQPMTKAAAGTMVITIGANHAVIATHDRHENGFEYVEGLGNTGRDSHFRIFSLEEDR